MSNTSRLSRWGRRHAWVCLFSILASLSISCSEDAGSSQVGPGSRLPLEIAPEDHLEEPRAAGEDRTNGKGETERIAHESLGLPLESVTDFDIGGSVMGLEWDDPFTSGAHMIKNFEHNYVWVGTRRTVTDDVGRYLFKGVSPSEWLISYLEGPWVKVLNARTPRSMHFYGPLSGPVWHSWSWNGYDLSYLHEESNVFYHVNKIHDYLDSIGVTEMYYQMEATVNVDDSFGTLYDGSSIWFCQAGSGFESAGVISDLIYHTYVEAVIHRLAPGLYAGRDYGESGNLYEAIADYLACSLNANPDFAEGFIIGSSGPLRVCNSDDTFPEDYSPIPPGGAQIISGALWDMRQTLGQDLADRLLIEALRLDPAGFAEFLETLLVADDDDSDLDNGTPNLRAICNAFSSHGVRSEYCRCLRKEARLLRSGP
jgi:hypothetical protein